MSTNRKRHLNPIIAILAGLLCAVLIASCVSVYTRVVPNDPTPVPLMTPEPTQEPTPIPTYETTLFDTWKSPYTSSSLQLNEIDNETNFVTTFGVEYDSGSISNNYTFDEQVLNIYDMGENIYAARFYRDGISYASDTSVSLYFNASSTLKRDVNVSAYDPDTEEILFEETIHLTNELTSYELHFYVESSSTWNGRLTFNLGNDGHDRLTEHSVTIEHLRIISNDAHTTAYMNQVGYFRNSQKRVTFPYAAGDCFDVVNAETGNVVYTGAIVHGRDNEDTGEKNFYGDFSHLQEDGTYFIRTQIGDVSEVFTISENPYQATNDALLKMIALQRCGTTLDASWAHELAHEICHHDIATVYETERTYDVSGGWHDAGDYGRFTNTATKAVSDLLMAYLVSPDSFSDQGEHPNSHNGIPNILDEARYELEWLLKMQDEYGGVFSKVLTENNPDYIDPSEDTDPLYLVETDTGSSGHFAGVMAFASIIYQDIDPTFASTCLESAKSAYQYLKEHPDTIVANNPSGINGGTYYDTDDLDARFYTASALYVATGEKKYLSEAKDYYAQDSASSTGLLWSSQGGYGRYLLLLSEDAIKDDHNFIEKLQNDLLYEADGLIGIINSNSYETSIYEYTWGSNGIVANNGVLLSMAYHLTGESYYQHGATEQLNYLLGKNSLDMSFVSGIGHTYPVNVHSRLSVSHQTLLPGALVGGPDGYFEDAITQTLSSDTPEAKVYVDHIDSYTTNEVSIYWNSAMIHLLAQLSH